MKFISEFFSRTWNNTTKCYERVCEGQMLYKNSKFGVKLSGNWNKSLSQTFDGVETEIWRLNDPVNDEHFYYFLTRFGLQLNQLDESKKKQLPQTDSRFRKDIRALENAEIQLASELY